MKTTLKEGVANMKRQTYKFRAECIGDVTKFMERAWFLYTIKVTRVKLGKPKTLWPDVLAEITTKESLGKMISVFQEITDSHVMIETIAPKKLFTGVRKTGQI